MSREVFQEDGLAQCENYVGVGKDQKQGGQLVDMAVVQASTNEDLS